MARKTTNPPEEGRPIVLYDGRCRFCTTGAERLRRSARGAIDTLDFQQPGVLEKFPGITHEECMRAFQLVDRQGRVYAGAEAIVRSLRFGRPVLGHLAHAYYLPGLRWILDRLYDGVARNRSRLFGRCAEACDEGGTCDQHFW